MMTSTISTSRTFISADGSTVAYQTVGQGPAVIVVPGALSTAETYAAFATALGRHFTVHTLERRGRGLSVPQGHDYSLAKEREDLLALQRITGATLLVGHSYGGLICLESARNQPVFTRVAVYEPGVSIDGSINMSWMDAYGRCLARGKELDAFVTFVLGTGPDRFRNMPHWYMRLLMPLFLNPQERKERFPLLAESLREHQEVARYDNSYKNYGEISAEVLLMTGGATGSRWVEIQPDLLIRIIPHFQSHRFAKFDHFGIDKKAPQVVAEVVHHFFQE
jgi:pimeloyl-ACP methyl ester carboxylesterase